MGLFRRKPKDDFKALAEERRSHEDDAPWFAAPDDGPELRIETGIGSNLTEADAGSGSWDEDPEAER